MSDADFHAAWVAALDRLEVDVALAETMLASASAEEPQGLPSWAPPPVRGPLPSDLEPRARLVLERQLAVAHRITQRLTQTGRHRQLTQRIRSTAHPEVPVYVDLQA
jgi:hypothetical protein